MQFLTVYFRAVKTKWYALVTGGAIAVGFLVVSIFGVPTAVLPAIGIMVLALFVAQFQVWRDEYKKRQAVEHDRDEAVAQSDDLRRQLNNERSRTPIQATDDEPLYEGRRAIRVTYEWRPVRAGDIETTPRQVVERDGSWHEVQTRTADIAVYGPTFGVTANAPPGSVNIGGSAEAQPHGDSNAPPAA